MNPDFSHDFIQDIRGLLAEGGWNLTGHLSRMRGEDPQMFAHDIDEDFIVSNFGFSPKSPNNLVTASAFSSGLTTITTQNSWVGAAINLNMRFTGMAPVVIEEMGKEKPIPLSQTKYKFLLVPNSYMRLQEIMEATSFWLDVAGEAFVYLERDGMKLPTEIHSIPPYMMGLKNFGEEAPVQWYFRTPTGEDKTQHTIPPHKILHLKNYGVYRTYGTNYYELFGNPIRGVSPALPILKTLATDAGVTNFLNTYTSGETLLSGILKPGKDSRLGRGQRETLIKQIRQQIGSFTDAQKLLILNHHMEFQESSFNPFELSQKEIKDITKQEVCAIFGVNPVMLGDFDQIQSYEGIKTAEKIYYHREIIPRLNKIKDAFYHAIFMFHDGGRFRLDFDLSKVEALDDYDIRLERAMKLMDLGFPLNKVNEKLRLGMDNVEGGDKPGRPGQQGMEEETDGDKARKRKSRDSAEADEKDDTDRPRRSEKK